MNDVRTYEYKEKLKDIRKQYAPPAAPPGLWHCHKLVKTTSFDA
jgi:hypothetical protein